ncbi:MAG TPA: BON domain-containing protein [Candidatus Polarisedimenticolia bacterium]|nr:BON domain-containing protein [Candidatus Polarisedimenticolia bacterium]
MRKNKIGILALVLMLTMSVSCSRIGKPSDDAITTDIKAKMFSEPALKAATVDVVSKQGEVTLTGQVPDDAARLAAYKIASETKGVSRVNDQMSVAAAQISVPQAAAPTPQAAPAKRAIKAKTSAKAEKSRQTAAVSPASSAAEPMAAASPPAAEPAPPPPPQPVTMTVPANTIVTVRTIDSIDSKTNQAGQVFKASLDAPIVVDNKVIVPAGADAYVKLVDAKSAGRVTGRSELGLELASIVFQGKTYNVVSSDVKQSGTSRGKQSAERIGGGAALGALIGAVAGGGKGAAIGAAVGGGAGTGVQVFTKGQQVKIPSETRLDFTLQQPLDITYLPGKRSRQHSSADQAPADPNSQNPPSN